MARTTLFKSNRSQAVRLPKEVAFPENVKSVTVRREGNKRIITAGDGSWDDFFDAPGIDLGAREQPGPQERAGF
ncbi:type II toxin-antitoxin system VapB family antitoxin [Sphingosinicella terrae]|jgi:antitoxin VapB|uniref:type II toxin-antitoxin system VapB family antitoxin n=1 Tax=Sphingosinicella terrae TaxID=2172047 RepID=UPI000E0DE67A|nr:type II toxin-antitoxin system VapB family antitoxin [Sphingosinicella terrae]